VSHSSVCGALGNRWHPRRSLQPTVGERTANPTTRLISQPGLNRDVIPASRQLRSTLLLD
jgi:hypothetical protein